MINKIILIGTVCSDPAFAYGGENEEAVFALKTGITKRKATRTEKVQWHRVLVVGHFVHLCKNIRKNDIVYVEGVLSTSLSATRTDGNEQAFNSEVVATDIKVLSESTPSSPGKKLANVLIDKIKNKG